MKQQRMIETRTLLYVVVGFMMGILLAFASLSFKGATPTGSTSTEHSHMAMTMDSMNSMLEGKTGDEFDEAFLSEMITHHEGAVSMAALADKHAKHQEIKDMAKNIEVAQTKEIDTMRSWQVQWNYVGTK